MTVVLCYLIICLALVMAFTARECGIAALLLVAALVWMLVRYGRGRDL